jgi:microsomal dipeptidase-like Zn-dependent dipeptidase
MKECSIVGTVLVPEFKPELILSYYNDVMYFKNLDEYFLYIHQKTWYNTIKLFFSLENLHILDSYKKIVEYKKNGLIMVQLYHNDDNAYFSRKTGLSKEGKNLLNIMEEHAIILDISHIDEYWIEKVARNFHGKIAVSHCACNELYTNKKHRSNSLSWNSIKQLGKKNALFGIAFVNDIIAADSYDMHGNDKALLHDLVNQLKLFIDAAGIHSIALGPDFFDTNYFSRIFNTPLHIPQQLFHDDGYTWIRKQFIKDEIDALFYKNVVDFIR